MSSHNKSKNFKNGVFVNTPSISQLRAGLNKFDIVKKYYLENALNTEPAGSIPIKIITLQELEAVRDTNEIHIYRLGHSTMLMKFGSDYWLTDPVFSERASPSRWFGPKRFHPSPISIDQLPHLKGVIISHNHYDHLDKSAIKKIHEKTDRFIVPLGLSEDLIKWGVKTEKIIQLDWWQSYKLGGISISATPAQHFSGRGLNDANKTLWASFVINYKKINIFFSGDSGYFNGFKEIAKRYGPFDLTMMESGAYDPDWPDVHMTPEQTVQAHKDLNGKTLMPIHNGTFNLAFHSWKEPFEKISNIARANEIPLLTPIIGERIILNKKIETNDWWSNID